jgi:hypothetical protein
VAIIISVFFVCCFYGYFFEAVEALTMQKGTDYRSADYRITPDQGGIHFSLLSNL